MAESTIILIAYFGDDWLAECLSDLEKASKKRTQLILVDNHGNSDLTQMGLDAFEAEIIKSKRPLGFAEANNFALVQTKQLGDYIVFLNQDTKTRDDWLEACIKCLESDPAIAAVTPMTRTYNWQDWDRYFLECSRKSGNLAQDFDEGNELAPFYETSVIPAAAMVVRRSVLEQVGPFDPIYGSYYEDYDLCHRIRAAGYKVGVCTGGTIAHFSGSASQTEAAEKRRARWVTRNRVIFNQRVAQEARWLLLFKHFFLVFPRGLARSILRRPAAKPLMPYLQAHADLIWLAPRLISAKRDQALWWRYLNTLGWPRAG